MGEKRFQALVTGRCVAAVVCLLLMDPAGLATVRRPVGKQPRAATMSQHQKVLQALNRFTFGARPGDAAAVRRVGLDAWFEQQLHPERIADQDLEARLAQFPAMQLSQSELMERFPSPQRLRQYSNGAIEAPDDPAEQAIYADASLNYEQKRAAKLAPAAMTVKPGSANLGANALNGGGAVPAVRNLVPAQGSAKLNELLALAPAERMRRLVALSPEAMQGLRESLKGGDQARLVAGFSPEQVEQVAAMQAPMRVVETEAVNTRLLRDVYSDRQLQAVMTEFWLNHFNVYAKKDQEEPFLLPAYEREAILPHALGRFEDLLIATAQSPAMLVYLDNATSIGPNSRAADRFPHVKAVSGAAPGSQVTGKVPKGINENYARELMELHTLGVNGGYTQQDVIEVAKCFTGWTTERLADGKGFIFNANRHEPGSKLVLGQVIPEGGESEGLAVLHLLASSPSTAHFLSLELAQQFVSDAPPRALVDRMAAAYLRSDGDIATVLRTMFRSPEFWSVAAYRAKVKTPLEFVVSALRAGNAEVRNPAPLTEALTRLGMPLYGMQTPNGYGLLAADWVSSSALLNRMNFALTLAGNRVAGTRLVWTGAGSDDEAAGELTNAQTEQRLETAILGESAGNRTRAAVLDEADALVTQSSGKQDLSRAALTSGMRPAGQSGTGLIQVRATQAARPKAPDTLVDSMAGLLLGSPEFQRR